MSMSQAEQYEVLVLGSGAGGKLLAWHTARSGRRTAVVERKWIGGSCPNVELLELDRVPEHLVVLGGGYVGLEFAQASRRFGSRVTVVEHGPQLVGSEDADVAEEIRRILAAESVEVVLGADVLGVEGRSG